jgi:hypothetical protein
MTLPTPTLEPVADLTVFVATPIEAGAVTGLNSRGRRRIIPITGGKVTGQLNGTVLPGGADFQIVVSDTCADLDARYLLQLDTGEHVFVMNRACAGARWKTSRSWCAASRWTRRRSTSAARPPSRSHRPRWPG